MRCSMRWERELEEQGRRILSESRRWQHPSYTHYPIHPHSSKTGYQRLAGHCCLYHRTTPNHLIPFWWRLLLRLKRKRSRWRAFSIWGWYRMMKFVDAVLSKGTQTFIKQSLLSSRRYCNVIPCISVNTISREISYIPINRQRMILF